MTNKKWNAHLSVNLTSVIIKVMFAIFAVALFGMPYYAKYMNVALSGKVYIPFLIAFYFCAAFAFTALFNLNKLLKNIKSEKIFVHENVKYMRILSWCCFAVAIATFILEFWIYHFFVITAAASFFGLILRVLKNVFEEAVKIREENDFTI
ncbi:MAG TPA: DUF2975 domain-containing protein [Oscillospiraceae bacterium]|nr:DUF2975 domain-containing protein [Oscillospiraceae bacterium]